MTKNKSSKASTRMQVTNDEAAALVRAFITGLDWTGGEAELIKFLLILRIMLEADAASLLRDEINLAAEREATVYLPDVTALLEAKIVAGLAAFRRAHEQAQAGQ